MTLWLVLAVFSLSTYKPVEAFDVIVCGKIYSRYETLDTNVDWVQDHQQKDFFIQRVPQLTTRIKLIESLSHQPNSFIEPFECIEKKGAIFYIVMSYHKQNSFQDKYDAFYKSKMKARFDEQIIRQYLTQLKDMVQLLQDHKQSHPGFYPSNLQILSNDRIQASAFGVLGIVPYHLQDVVKEIYVDPENVQEPDLFNRSDGL